LFEEIMAARYEFPEEYWGHISEEAKDFVSRLLLVNPHQRLTASQALQHPWLVNGGKMKPFSSFNHRFKDNLKKAVDKRRSTSSIRSL